LDIVVDQVKISQVLINIIANAIKFSKDTGTIEINVVTNDEHVLFSVRDHGIGISDDDQEIIFDSFRQIEGGHTRLYGGTGLGLSISKSLVEMHGGEIWVESELGAGSAFSFSIPHDEKLTPVSGKVLTENDKSPKKAILVLDDELHVLETATLALKSTGYRIETMANPAGFLDKMRELTPELVIIDIMMPKISGITLINEIRKNSQFKEQKILVSSAYYSNRSIVSELGAYWISKPWTNKELLQKISEIIDI